jgi:hypothetical protein
MKISPNISKIFWKNTPSLSSSTLVCSPLTTIALLKNIKLEDFKVKDKSKYKVQHFLGWANIEIKEKRIEGHAYKVYFDYEGMRVFAQEEGNAVYNEKIKEIISINLLKE